MNEARRTSPFAANQQQSQLEKWICRQHQQQELPQEQIDMPAETVHSEKVNTVQAAQMPKHRQYDAIVNKMRSARQQAGRDQLWLG